VVPAEQADAVVERLAAMQVPAWIIGEVAERRPGEPAVVIE
jgi:hydrogenase maturation factor